MILQRIYKLANQASPDPATIVMEHQGRTIEMPISDWLELESPDEVSVTVMRPMLRT